MSITYSIRRAEENDLHVLKELLISNKQKPTIVINDKTLYYVARSDEGALIGLIGAELSGTTALIRSTAVLAPYRSNGVARALIDALFKHLQDKGIQNLYLFSRDSGEYWKKFGFYQCTVQEVIEKLPDAPQVLLYINDNSIWSDIAWHRPDAGISLMSETKP